MERAMKERGLTRLLEEIKNLVLLRRFRARNRMKEFLQRLEEGVTDDILKVLLELMSLVFLIDRDFRRNIEGFKATYVFKDYAGLAYTLVRFKNNKMYVKRQKEDNPTFTLRYKDGHSLFKLLLSDSPNVLKAMLDQEVDFQGNINYINKFAYMAIHLKLKALGQLPE